MPLPLPPEFENRQNSDGLVWLALAEAGPMTYGEIAATTRVPRSTVTAALDRLRESGHVEKKHNPDDPSRPLYDTTEGGP